MLGQKFVAIGHIINDISPKEHLGGGVSYGAVTATKFGLDAHIITKCPPAHPYINILEKLGVTVHVLPSGLNTITTFDNRYDSQGRRKQVVSQAQEQISLKDEKNIPWHILKDSVIFVAPVTSQDVGMQLFPLLAKHGPFNLAPQGYFRKILRDGSVVPKKWEGFSEYASDMDTVVLSEEDILLQPGIIKSFSLLVLTRGSKGAEVYKNGKKILQAKAFPLKKRELIDFTGAGDVFAVAFILEMLKNPGDIGAASAAACLFASVKISGMGGIGIDSIPSREQVKEFLKKHSKLDKHVVKL